MFGETRSLSAIEKIGNFTSKPNYGVLFFGDVLRIVIKALSSCECRVFRIAEEV